MCVHLRGKSPESEMRNCEMAFDTLRFIKTYTLYAANIKCSKKNKKPVRNIRVNNIYSDPTS